MARDEHMVLAGFAQASNVTYYAGSWRYPSSAHRALSADFYIDLARLLDQGGFDLAFLDDRLAMPGVYGNSITPTVRRGVRPVKLDMTSILGVMAAHSTRLGLGATYSTTYYAPFHVARTFATLDHLSGGRAAWNIVTSLNSNEAGNFGAETIPHDERYERAEEFLEVVTGLWDTWGPDAIVEDREAGIWGDGAQVHELNYEGKWYSSRGPLTVPRTPQRWPLLIQAGQSGRGRDFAARWADLVFTMSRTLADAQKQYRDQRERTTAFGRSPSQLRILPAVAPVIGETPQIAREKVRLLNDLNESEAALILLSEVANLDLSVIEMDAPLTEDRLAGIEGGQGIIDVWMRSVGATGDGSITLRELALLRGSLDSMPTAIGTAAQVADTLEEWFEGHACDGFAVIAPYLPGTFEDFVRMVVPELRRRGLIAAAPGQGPLRQRLGLDERFAGSA
jgi:FMN-dependent oxidoreductase (nitrilotriacetate monooxygenase family)